MVARVVPQSARRRHAESRKPDLRGVVARPKAPVLQHDVVLTLPGADVDKVRQSGFEDGYKSAYSKVFDTLPAQCTVPNKALLHQIYDKVNQVSNLDS